MPVLVRDSIKAPRRQRLHRLANDRTAGAEFAPEVGLLGERFAGVQVTADDPGPRLFHHVREEIALAVASRTELESVLSFIWLILLACDGAIDKVV